MLGRIDRYVRPFGLQRRPSNEKSTPRAGAKVLAHSQTHETSYKSIGILEFARATWRQGK
jgi:hypothetical protein